MAKKKNVGASDIILWLESRTCCIFLNNDCRIIQVRYKFVSRHNELKYKNLYCIFLHILPFF